MSAQGVQTAAWEPAAGLAATLESPLPRSLPAGGASAVFCYGTCFHRSERVTRLEILVDGGGRHPVAARGMPRPDVFEAVHPRGAPSPEDPQLHSFLSGWWGTVSVDARERTAGGFVELALAARLRSGAEHVARLGRISIGEPRGTPAPGVDPGLIAVCMATFEPDLALFRAQIESLRAQTDRRWTCVISDDCSSLERFAQITAVLDGDPRFLVSRSDRRLGFYRNFERVLEHAPAEAGLLALCDQDDRWRPEKLAVLRRALGGAVLVYSDQRLVEAGGGVLRETLWRGRRNNHANLASMLVANTITGAATLFRREVADLALPFPDTPGLQFHDHWLGLVALAAGDVAYVDRPLYDYVQHRGAVFGDVTRPDEPRRSRGGLLRGGRAAYFLGYLPREVQAQVLLARCAARLTPSKRRVLRRFVACDRSLPALVWLAARPLRLLLGRTETLASETELVRGLVWRRLVAILATGARGPRRLPLDARFPDVLSFEQERLRRWRARV